MYRVWGFLKRHAMPSVAVLAALLTCVAVPPDAAYAGYIDPETLGKLACMLLAVGGLGASGAFQALAQAVASRCRAAGALVFALVGVTALASMFVTNDMALLCLLPLAAASLLAAGRAELIAPVFVLQGLAANLCGMLLPFGNPQNIYLAGTFGVGFAEFVATMLPTFLASCALIALGCALVARRARWAGAREGECGAANASVPSAKVQSDAQVELDVKGVRDSSTSAFSCEHATASLAGTCAVDCHDAHSDPCEERSADGLRMDTARRSAESAACEGCVATSQHPPVAPAEGRLAACSLVSLVACVLAVVHVLPVWMCTLVTVACTLLGRPALFLRTDWSLVITFAAFFVFSGNLARIPGVQAAFADLIKLAGGAFLPGALLSQVISNVPAAIVLARFTADWPGLLVGVNVGGAGTPIGSLATLIVLAQYAALARELHGRIPASPQFLACLVGANMAALVALLALGCALGW